MMKLAVIGSRNFNDYARLKEELRNIPGVSEIVSGGSKGADSLAAKYAQEQNLILTEFLPDYRKYGRSAPHVRNSQIVDYCDKLIAFWDGKSPGTKSTIEKAKKSHKLLNIF